MHLKLIALNLKIYKTYFKLNYFLVFVFFGPRPKINLFINFIFGRGPKIETCIPILKKIIV